VAASPLPESAGSSWTFGNGDRGWDFLGRPNVEWSTLGAGSTIGTKLIITRELRAGYKIVDRLGMSVELIPHILVRRTCSRSTCAACTATGRRRRVVAVNASRYLDVK
jgi:hypothetical protein